MKRAAFFFGAIATIVANAAVQLTETPGPWDLYQGSKKLATYNSIEKCRQGAVDRATSAAKTYTCRTIDTLKVVVVPDPNPLPPPEMHVGVYIDPATIPPPVKGATDERLTFTGQTGTPSDIGQFRTVCSLAKVLDDDPIVLPGQPGRSHWHNYFGNDSMNANSTLATMRQGGSTCRGGTINQTAYWAPALLDGVSARWIRPDSAVIYYKNGYKLPTTTVFTPIPEGLKMVAGNPLAKGPGENGPAFFTCIDAATQTGPHTESIPACAPGNSLWASVDFPQCWDGKNLDSPDHRSHMAYPVQLQQPPFTWSCPSTHPVAFVDITINIVYTIKPGDDTTKWRASSDSYALTQPGGYSFHADWLNGWKPEIQKVWVDLCNNALKDCAAHLLGDGRQMDSFGGN